MNPILGLQLWSVRNALQADPVGTLEKIAWHFGEPFADASAIPLYHLSRITRDYVTVALNGDGGDTAHQRAGHLAAQYTRSAGDRNRAIFEIVPRREFLQIQLESLLIICRLV